MIYLLDKNGKEFAVTPSVLSHDAMSFEKQLLGIDECGVFYSTTANCTERYYIDSIRISGFDRDFDIVGFDYKCRHYKLIRAGIAKEDVARRLF